MNTANFTCSHDCLSSDVAERNQQKNPPTRIHAVDRVSEHRPSKKHLREGKYAWQGNWYPTFSHRVLVPETGPLSPPHSMIFGDSIGVWSYAAGEDHEFGCGLSDLPLTNGLLRNHGCPPQRMTGLKFSKDWWRTPKVSLHESVLDELIITVKNNLITSSHWTTSAQREASRSSFRTNTPQIVTRQTHPTTSNPESNVLAVEGSPSHWGAFHQKPGLPPIF